METSVKKVRKRDGRIVKFDQEKITNAIFKAAESVGGTDRVLAEKLSDKVVALLEEKYDGHTIPSVEEVQDYVEKALIESGHVKTAKAYILYRQRRADLRRAKSFLGIEDDIKLSLNAAKVLEKRYLKKDESGQVIESPKEMFKRVAENIASADSKYGASEADVKKTEKEFYNSMINLEFLPNSPTLMNAGRDLQQLSACFVLPVEDDLSGIFETLKSSALIHQSGGGTGFSFSRLRPAGSTVRSTSGVASGPISFMRVFNTATEVIKQGGTRRGANMGILRVDHPDVLDFIVAKEREGSLNNFNISVALTEKFMQAIEDDGDYELVDPRTKKTAGTLNARRVFDLMVTMAWKNGEPGIIFIDRINKDNPTPSIGQIESTNPCGEVPLLPYESCNLASINLSKMVAYQNEEAKIDYPKLRKIVRMAVHFLDDVIDMNHYPLPEIDKMTKANRKIGLGVMGFADMLITLGIPYNSEDAVRTAEEVMKFVHDEGVIMSQELAKERGPFPNFKKSIFKGGVPRRHATITTVAPTGTISIIANASSGIEPLFAISYIRKNILDSGDELIEVNPIFEQIAYKRGFYSDDLMRRIAARGSIQGVEDIPKDVRRVFVTSHDIIPDYHIKMQAAFQKYTDNSISKCIAGDTIVFSEKGMLPIDELGHAPDGHFSHNPLKIYSNNSIRIARDFYNGGAKHTVKITSKYGYSIEGTPNHRIYIMGENGEIAFKQLFDIKAGDYVAIQRGQNFFGNKTDLPSFPYKEMTCSKKHKLPKELNGDFAYFLGCLTSEGNLTDNGGCITNCNRSVLKRLGLIVKDVFGLSSRVAVDKRNGVTTLVINSRKLVRYLEHLGVKRGAENKEIPRCIMQTTRGNVIEFLNGLFLDAYIPQNQKNKFGICLKSKKLIGQLHVLLLNLGIVGNMFEKRSYATNSSMKPATYYEIQVCGDSFVKLIDMIKFSEGYKNVWARKNIRSHYNTGSADSIPFIGEKVRKLAELSKRSKTRASSLGYGVFKKSYLIKHNIKAKRLRAALDYFSDVKGTKIYKELTSLLNKNFFYDIVDKKNYGLNKVYDFYVPANNRFFANGFINHNTINFPSSATTRDVENAYMMAYKLGCKGVTIYRDQSRREQVLNIVSEKKEGECTKCAE